MPYTSRETYEFISCQTNDPIVEWKTCKVSGQPFPIYQSDMDFYEKISPTFNGKKFGIPTPTLCPEERERRRLAFRNERELYRRKCDFSGKSIISIYSPDKPFKVYEQDIWWSDKRNPFDYGRLFTFQQSFFEQFASLLADVPKIALYEKSNENSIYTNDTTHNKNCYLIFSSDYNENCCYGVFNNSKSSIDCLECRSIEKCYECVNCLHCHKLFYALDCEQCTHSSFLINCVNCDHCFLSHNLNGKRYYFLNKPYSPQEYQEKIKNLTLKEAKKNFETVIQKTIHRHLKINASENCIGNDIEHSQNCKYCFDTLQARNCSYIFFGSQTLSDCQDTICASIDASKCYQVQNCLEHCHQIMSCNFSNNIQFSYYLNNCINCSQCFGCVGLRNKEYCIFNKQYEKTEYERLIFQIIEKMQED
ncbi:MAG: hypothetical protein LBP53_01015 [Candidatus Peribacteria bacterium]|jgi:hypothetical protein|nr:hypothetical protein [Candidatus Peribacteria bacterium]